MGNNAENEARNVTGSIAGDQAQTDSPLEARIKNFGNASLSHGKGYAVDDKSIQESASMHGSTVSGPSVGHSVKEASSE